MTRHLALVPLTLHRMRANAWLAACALAALTLAVALAVAVPVYAEAAGLRLLAEGLERQEARTGRPAFALLIRHLGSWGVPHEAEALAPADALVAAALDAVGLPAEGYARHARTVPMPLAPGGEGRLLDVALGFVTGMDAHMRIVDGSAPRPADRLDAPVEILATRALAERAGLNVGDELTLIGRAGGRAVGIPVRIAGLWEAVDPGDPAWFYPPESFDEVLLAAEASFRGPVAAALDDEVAQALWFARLDGAGLSAATAGGLAGRVERLGAAVAAALPGARLEQSPAAALEQYGRDNAALTARLVVFAAPVVGLVVAFVALVGGLMVRRQAPEIALLKTRGIGDGQILGMVAIEWLCLGAAAMVAGPPLGVAFAGLIARTGSFLRLDPELPAVRLALTPGHLAFGLAAVAVALAAVLLPARLAARRTLVDVQRHAARPEAPPLWRRAWIDLLLLPAPLYGLYQLRAGGGLLLDAGAGRDLAGSPLLALTPALLSLSLGLLTLRLLPPLLELAARAAARPAWAAPLVALRALARQPGAYGGPLLLLILTLSLACFSAAAAATLDGALRRAVTYQVGAAAQLIETGESTEGAGADGRPRRRDIAEEPRFLFVPVAEHLTVPGITAAARVGRYAGRLPSGQEAQLVGVDRLALPAVLRGFDPAWAGGVPLGELMNRLAARPAGALVSADLLDSGVTVGDSLSLRAELFGDRRTIALEVVGAVELFPGLYPQDGPLVIANLDHLFDQMGGQYPYDVWVDYAPGADAAAIAAGVRALGVELVEVRDLAGLIRAEQVRPLRQGLFGLLSIGFVAASGLTVVGFLITTALTARRRTLELGVLRAIGMGARAAAVALAVEQGAIVAAGLAAGGLIGALCALLVVPALRVGVGPHPGTPPAPPQLPWGAMALAAAGLAAAVLLALLGLAAALRRASLFTVVKMGE